MFRRKYVETTTKYFVKSISVPSVPSVLYASKYVCHERGKESLKSFIKFSLHAMYTNIIVQKKLKAFTHEIFVHERHLKYCSSTVIENKDGYVWVG